jgi:hypothetical protein
MIESRMPRSPVESNRYAYPQIRRKRVLAAVRVVLKHQATDEVNFDQAGSMAHKLHCVGIGNQVEPVTNPVCTQEQGIPCVVVRLINLTRVNRQANIVVFMANVPQGRQEPQRISLVIIFSAYHVDGDAGLIF